MSKKEDIIDKAKAYDPKNRYGLVYTCNCGWLDLGHLNPENKDPRIGAANLWRQVNNGGPDAAAASCDQRHAARASFLGAGPIACSVTDGKARFKDGATGFKVTYRQDMGRRILGKKIAFGVDGNYLVRHNLTVDQRKSVALAIFLEVSMGFERFQGSFPWGLVTDSSFSQEDLISNLIGFYVAIGEVTKKQALDLCHVVSEEASVAVWEANGPVGANKNTALSPALAQHTLMTNGTLCKDECALQPKQFPAAFQRIQPAGKGALFIDLPTAPPR